MNQLSALETVIIKCRECGCSKEIFPKEIPVGDCQYCKEEFGYYFFPGQFLNEDGTLNNDNSIIANFEFGDIITLDTRLKAEDPKRIYSVKRNGKILYERDLVRS